MPQERKTTRENVIRYLAFAGVLLVLGSLIFLLDKPKKTWSFGRILMGTLVEIVVSAEGRSEKEARAIAFEAFDEVSRLEALLSSYKPESDVARINAAGAKAVDVSGETLEVVETALDVARLSKGRFDPTIGPLASLWDFSDPAKLKIPEKDDIDKAVGLVDYRSVVIDKDASTIKLGKGMKINLGGVAKGYIVGRAIEVLKSRGIRWGIIRAGGDMFLFKDNKQFKEPFKVGITHPRKEDALLGTISIEGGAVATSGDYERFVTYQGVRYHHIIDTKTGMPAKGVVSVTIVSQNPTLADALSTAVFVMGAEEGLSLIESLERVECVIMKSSGKILVSSGLEGSFQNLL